MDNMLDLNHQIVYYHDNNRMGISMNLMSFGFRQFISTTKWQKRESFKNLCVSIENGKKPDAIALSEFAFDNLIDSIRITICFENFMKAFLLLNGFVIHKLDKNLFKKLHDEQKKRPIRFEEILSLAQWKVNESIPLSGGLKNQIDGINKSTIGMSVLLEKGYLDIFNISDEIISICKPYFKNRNKLHLYMEESLFIGTKDYFLLTQVASFLNKNLVRIHNDVIDRLNKGDSYKLQSLKFS